MTTIITIEWLYYHTSGTTKKPVIMLRPQEISANKSVGL